MEVVILIIIFYIGACFGSLYDVLIYRLPREINIVQNRSYCPTCKHYLMPVDLLPIISFLCLKGKCRYCNESISIRSFFIEILSGILFSLAFYKYGWTSFTLIQIIFWGMLILVSFIDYDTMYIYDSMLLFYFIIFVIYYGISGNMNIWTSIKGTIYCFAIFSVIYFLSKLYYGQEAFGFGDVLLNSVLGFYLGSHYTFLICFLPFYVATVDLLLRTLLCRNNTFRREVSFAPYMCVSAWIISLYGKEIYIFLGKYLSVFGGV